MRKKAVSSDAPIAAQRDTSLFEDVVRTLPYSILICAPDTLEIRFANPASLKMIARLEGAIDPAHKVLVGAPVTLFQRQDPDAIAKVARQGSGRCVVQLASDWVELRFASLPAGDGLPVSLLVTWNIVTERVEFAKILNAQLIGITDAVVDLEASGNAMDSAVNRAAGKASEVASVSSRAAGNVNTVSGAAEELAKSIREIDGQVEHSTEVAARAVAQAETTNATIQSLAEATDRIGKVVDLISNIAGQTNLLALNATIEAARAGDAGKGFAVVASEVKALANQTAKATGEIGTQISAIQGVMKNAVGAIGAIRDIIDEINTISSSISVAVDQQTAAAGAIASNIHEAVSGTSQVNTAIGTVADAVTQTREAASDMVDSVKTLTTNSKPMRAHIESYLKKISS